MQSVWLPLAFLAFLQVGCGLRHGIGALHEVQQLPSLVPPRAPPGTSPFARIANAIPLRQPNAQPQPAPAAAPTQPTLQNQPTPATQALQGQAQAQPQTQTQPQTQPQAPATTTGPAKKPTGWLTKAGSFTVEKLDRSTRRATSPLQMPVNKFLLHTLEGIGGNGDWESGTAVLDGNRYWTHFIIAKDRSGKTRIGQYLPLDVYGFALAANNVKGAIQVEIGAKAAKPFTSNDADITAAVKALWQALHEATNGGIPMACPVAFKNDNGAYGAKSSTRLSASQFASTAGLVGHQHAPAPDTHWDPGAINCQSLITGAGTTAATATVSSSTATPQATAQAPTAAPQCDSAGLANCQKFGGGHACFHKFPGCLGNQAAGCKPEVLNGCLTQGRGEACWAEAGCQKPAPTPVATPTTAQTPTPQPAAGSGSGPNAGECPGAADWQALLQNPNVGFMDTHVSGKGVGDGATAKDNAQDAAAGKKVKTSAYGHAGGAKVCLHASMPKFLAAVAAKGKVMVTSMAGSRHGDGSAHYRGLAVDVGKFDGQMLTTGYRGTTTVIAACRAAGASKVGHNSLGWSGHQTWVHCRFG